MWNYPSVEARMKTRAAVDADPDWQGFRTKVTGFVEEMQSFLLIPTPYSAMK
ncbi:MAG: NIPSNAP family protein, partial [Rhodospirillales bacterium]|nr:NIPSNAP family protein [Rhodospirillales bacterium]